MLQKNQEKPQQLVFITAGKIGLVMVDEVHQTVSEGNFQ
jgi:hypothetical protein